ncbi:Hypothetical predicted protein [Marmota monax]|uniref:Interleukin-1 receptor antagonist protein n=1 Tax=Marmota monax TaxID=9995 RepID=A0A5E4D3U9_MARMO|nr:Hypothetical predicted protein [Marmota monax]
MGRRGSPLTSWGSWAVGLSLLTHVLGVQVHTPGRTGSRLGELWGTQEGADEWTMHIPGVHYNWVLFLFRIWDINQKTFYLRNNQLVAGYLQGPNIKLEEKIDMVPIDPHAMFLGIHGGKLCLSCVKSGDDIRLQLEVRICSGASNPSKAQWLKAVCSHDSVSGPGSAGLFGFTWRKVLGSS